MCGPNSTSTIHLTVDLLFCILAYYMEKPLCIKSAFYIQCIIQYTVHFTILTILCHRTHNMYKCMILHHIIVNQVYIQSYKLLQVFTCTCTAVYLALHVCIMAIWTVYALYVEPGVIMLCVSQILCLPLCYTWSRKKKQT